MFYHTNTEWNSVIFLHLARPMVCMTQILLPRTWQRRLQSGRFRRNSVALKPAIWLLQKVRLSRLPHGHDGRTLLPA